MSDSITVKVQGLEAVRERLRRLASTIASDALPTGLAEGGAILEDAVRRRTHVKSGDLAEHLTTVVAVTATGGEAKIGYGEQGHKALWLEYGHRELTHGSTGVRREVAHVPAYPTMRPALEEAADPAVEAVADAIRKILSK